MDFGSYHTGVGPSSTLMSHQVKIGRKCELATPQPPGQCGGQGTQGAAEAWLWAQGWRVFASGTLKRLFLKMRNLAQGRFKCIWTRCLVKVHHALQRCQCDFGKGQAFRCIWVATLHTTGSIHEDLVQGSLGRGYKQCRFDVSRNKQSEVLTCFRCFFAKGISPEPSAISSILDLHVHSPLLKSHQ